MEKNKKLIMAMVTIMVLVIGVIGASYAYFAASVANNAVTNVIVKANTLDTLTYISGTNLSLTLTQDNMAKGSSNVTISSTPVTPKATLTAGNNSASRYCYDVYVDTITNNATGQTAGTMFVSCNGTNGVTALYCSLADITSAQAGSSTLACSNNQIQASAGATAENTYSCTVNFKNYSGTDQSSLANQIVYQGKIRFQTTGCGGASEPN